MSTVGPARYVWKSPDGRTGPACKTVSGAVRSAVRNWCPTGQVKVSFDTAAALALWPVLKADGWRLLRVAP